MNLSLDTVLKPISRYCLSVRVVMVSQDKMKRQIPYPKHFHSASLVWARLKSDLSLPRISPKIYTSLAFPALIEKRFARSLFMESTLSVFACCSM